LLPKTIIAALNYRQLGLACTKYFLPLSKTLVPLGAVAKENRDVLPLRNVNIKTTCPPSEPVRQVPEPPPCVTAEKSPPNPPELLADVSPPDMKVPLEHKSKVFFSE
jgi:hypothetical protein